MSGADAVIDIANVSKTFATQKALDDVSMTVREGEVHALLGGNGSGKSTLIKILAGYHRPDDDGAVVTIGGQPLEFGTPQASHEAGLRFVHQRLSVILEFNAVENMAMEIGFGRPAFIDWRDQERETRQLLSRLNVDMDIWKPLAQCKPVERSAVAIARSIATHRGLVRTVFLDEPTASLPEPEVEQLFRVIRELTSTGISVVYVSHRLDEIFQIADRVTVLRDGKRRATADREGLTRDQLVEYIVGRDFVDDYEAPVVGSSPVASDGDAVRAEGLTAGRLQDVSFTVRKGEVVGFVGLAGSGREDVARALVGAIPPDGGFVYARGEAIHPLNPANALKHGLVLGLSNTQHGSALRDFNVTENVSLSSMPKYRRPFGPIRRKAERRDVMHWADEVDIKPPDPKRMYALLSGGNQQKVIIAKALNVEPDVLVLDDPTAGVDVGARHAIYGIIAAEAAKGRGVVMCSADLEDIISTCHRVLVMRGGRIVAEIEGELDESRLLTIATQETDEDAAALHGEARG